jgi:hypothetical protein
MVNEIEKVLGAAIERRRLPGFDYGDFAPESQFQKLPQNPRWPTRAVRQFRPARARHGVRAFGQ